MKLGKTVNGLDKIMKSVLGQHLFKYIRYLLLVL